MSPQRIICTTESGQFHIAVEISDRVAVALAHGDPGVFPDLAKELAAGLTAAYATHPPLAEV